jgi:Rrf2 family protein
MNSEFTIAVHALVLLADKNDRIASSEYIANNIKTHPARVRKIMSKLKKSGFVLTKEGTQGGYLLNCNPNDITLDQVFRVMSKGTLQPNWCSGDPDHFCMVSSNMQSVMDYLFYNAEEHLLEYFSKVSIQSVLEKVSDNEQCKK